MVIIETLIVLSILIVVHEFGHFLIAKLRGVEVKTFSLGFGPKILGKKIGKTDFRISIIPFGGYVKLFGEDEKEREEPKSFFLQPYLTKFTIVVAGPLFNLLFGYIVFYLIFVFYGEQHIPSRKIVPPPEGSPASLAGFKGGDEIIGYDGRKFNDWRELLPDLQSRDTHHFVIRRGQDTLNLSLIPEWNEKKNFFETGISPMIPPVAGKIQPNSQADKAGLMPGDSIISIDNQIVTHWEELTKLVQENPGVLLQIKFIREGKLNSITVKPESTTIKEAEEEKVIGRLGVYSPVERVRPNPIYALWLALLKVMDIISRTFVIIGGLFIKRIPITSLGGPLMIGKMVGETAQMGLISLLGFVGFISLQLCLINLFPIPALDGGHLLIFTIEKLIRRNIPRGVQTIIQLSGILLLISFAIFITYLDILRIFTG